ncbi:Outer membrane protein assembly factor BamD [Shimia sp. SK013]|uniref:tol-pal system protein YbgF n=1 Tax=Shimia sp. SK013 TaxID=1389006 RepID=UPI0006B60CD2|nr:tol-pal system protein YbgF [Shimia sp. SK013]KPA20136.1 Outer membrane protein assembly factor BamD [Shimia sp. SK013]
MKSSVFGALTALALVMAPMSGVAQDNSETLADIRQQLTVLYVDIQRLKRELSTTGAPGGTTSGASTLERVDAIEQRLKELTGKTEQLQYRVERVVEDGTNRIGDLEFRLVELEGGDLSALGETTTLGGDVGSVEIVDNGDIGSGDGDATELAVGEEADFARAMTALDGGDFLAASDQFETFVQTYPGSPLEAEAHLRRGQALEGMQEHTRAARAFLEAYSGGPNAGTAPESLFRLGKSLGALGQSDEACVTLNEVAVRYPASEFVTQAQDEMTSLQCS